MNGIGKMGHAIPNCSIGRFHRWTGGAVSAHAGGEIDDPQICLQ
jgi:hypothetical protein